MPRGLYAYMHNESKHKFIIKHSFANRDESSRELNKQKYALNIYPDIQKIYSFDLDKLFKCKKFI